MSDIKLTITEYFKEFQVDLEKSNLDGIISNRTDSKKFEYRPDDMEGFLKASDLRAVADKLDELNELDNNFNWIGIKKTIRDSAEKVTLSGNQLKDALEFLAPDNTKEQLDSEVTIFWISTDDSSTCGYYAVETECEEEGSVFLDW